MYGSSVVKTVELLDCTCISTILPQRSVPSPFLGLGRLKLADAARLNKTQRGVHGLP